MKRGDWSAGIRASIDLARLTRFVAIRHHLPTRITVTWMALLAGSASASPLPSVTVALRVPDGQTWHFAGPTWEASDGSRVVGERKAKADAPQASAIPWLLLAAKSHGGDGALAKVSLLQRVETTGGKAPASGCDAAHANVEQRMAYTASYYFYAPR